MENLNEEFKGRLNFLADEIYIANALKGFWEDDRGTPECIALMHSELSEALEADRKDLMDVLMDWAVPSTEVAVDLFRVRIKELLPRFFTVKQCST